jgi:hypothetical protein
MLMPYPQGHALPRAPWTCCWGGVSVVAHAFPPCRHPVLSAKLRHPRAGDCQHCPYWEEWDPAEAVEQRQTA